MVSFKTIHFKVRKQLVVFGTNLTIILFVIKFKFVGPNRSWRSMMWAKSIISPEVGNAKIHEQMSVAHNMTPNMYIIVNKSLKYMM